MREVIDARLPACFQDPMYLGQAACRVWPMVQGERADRRVESSLREWQRADVPGLETNPLAEARLRSPSGRASYHLG